MERTRTICAVTEDGGDVISGLQKSVNTVRDCKSECEEHEWCRGIRIRQSFNGECRLLTNPISEFDGWKLFNSRNWAEPQNWKRIVATFDDGRRFFSILPFFQFSRSVRVQ